MVRHVASPRLIIAALISFWTLGALAQTTESETFEDWQADFNGKDMWFASPVVFPAPPYVTFTCYRGLLCGFFMVEEGTPSEGWQSPDTPVLITVDENPAMETSGNVFLSASGAGEITKDFAHQTLAMLKAMEGGKTLRVSIGDVEFVQPIAGFYDASMWALGKFAFAFAESRPVRTFGEWTAHVVRDLDGTEREWYVLSGDVRLRCRDGQLAMAPFADNPEEPTSGKLDIRAGGGINLTTSGDYPNRVADFTLRRVMGLSGRSARAAKHDVRVTITSEDGTTASYLIPTKGYSPAAKWVERKCRN